MSYESYERFLRSLDNERLSKEINNNYTRMANSETDHASAAWERMYDISQAEFDRRANV